MAATFGQAFPESGVSGRAVMADPVTGCSPIKPPPAHADDGGGGGGDEPFGFTEKSYGLTVLEELQILDGNFRARPLKQPDKLHKTGPSNLGGLQVDISSGDEDYDDSDYPWIQDGSNTRWIAIIARYGGCNFEQKVRHATLANYSAVIVYNVGSNKLVPMAGSDDALIPSVFLGGDDAQVLMHKYVYPKRPDLRIVVTDDHPFDINAYLLPFAIVVGICFVIMLVIVVYKCVQDYRRSRRHRLPKSALKKLPIHKFKQGDPFETCCICLDDFEEGDKLRILPCDHGYHAKCIDPWLVKTKRICPQCRKRVFESNERGAGLISVSSEDAPGSDSDSDFAQPSRNPPPPPVPQPSTSEREPLLPPARRGIVPRYTQRERRNFRRSQRRAQAAQAGTSQNSLVRNSSSQANPSEQGVEHPSGSGSGLRLSAERIRRAFVLGGRGNSSNAAAGEADRAPIMSQQQDIVSSEDYGETTDDELIGVESVHPPPTATTTTRVVTTNQEAVTVRIEQPTSAGLSGRHGGGGDGGGQSHQLVAEVHVVPAIQGLISNDEPREPRPEGIRTTHVISSGVVGSSGAADSSVIVIHPSDGESEGERGAGGQEEEEEGAAGGASPLPPSNTTSNQSTPSRGSRKSSSQQSRKKSKRSGNSVENV